jgi:hypothetical protein
VILTNASVICLSPGTEVMNERRRGEASTSVGTEHIVNTVYARTNEPREDPLLVSVSLSANTVEARSKEDVVNTVTRAAVLLLKPPLRLVLEDWR